MQERRLSLEFAKYSSIKVNRTVVIWEVHFDLVLLGTFGPHLKMEGSQSRFCHNMQRTLTPKACNQVVIEQGGLNSFQNRTLATSGKKGQLKCFRVIVCCTTLVCQISMMVWLDYHTLFDTSSCKGCKHILYNLWG